ncbi:hypothetical protein OUZ56_030489 [Daphnia magna]|uniref:Uncharacterized protein n=1 Tax=Daphnia magna TaxID=35525 RepID=A0ABQ9ZRG1_9CRUS|nr:hypothetical protein OUZ56_030489 [Daphnia magna]
MKSDSVYNVGVFNNPRQSVAYVMECIKERADVRVCVFARPCRNPPLVGCLAFSLLIINPLSIYLSSHFLESINQHKMVPWPLNSFPCLCSDVLDT